MSRYTAVAWEGGPRVPVYPSDHFGLLADFGASDAELLSGTHESENEAPAEDADVPPPGTQRSDAAAEHTALARWVRAEFASRSVRAVDLRGALRAAGVAAPMGRSLFDAVMAVRATFGDRVACGRFTVPQIKGILAALRQSRSGRKSQLVERLSNLLTPANAERRAGAGKHVVGLDELGGIDAYFDADTESSTEAAPRAARGVERDLAARNCGVSARPVGALLEPAARVGGPAS